jgi:hypothetical protein
MIPHDPSTKLTRRETAVALTEAGYRIAEATLATMATRDGGPPFEKWNRKPLYRWGDALAWAKARMSRPIRRARELREATDAPP